MSRKRWRKALWVWKQLFLCPCIHVPLSTELCEPTMKYRIYEHINYFLPPFQEILCSSELYAPVSSSGRPEDSRSYTGIVGGLLQVVAAHMIINLYGHQEWYLILLYVHRLEADGRMLIQPLQGVSTLSVACCVTQWLFALFCAVPHPPHTHMTRNPPITPPPPDVSYGSLALLYAHYCINTAVGTRGARRPLCMGVRRHPFWKADTAPVRCI